MKADVKLVENLVEMDRKDNQRVQGELCLNMQISKLPHIEAVKKRGLQLMRLEAWFDCVCERWGRGC